LSGNYASVGTILSTFAEKGSNCIPTQQHQSVKKGTAIHYGPGQAKGSRRLKIPDFKTIYT